MILDKYRTRYSYNILALIGLIELVLVLSIITPFYPGIMLYLCMWANVVIAPVMIIFLLIENKYLLRIKNKNFIDNKYVNIFRIIGFIFFCLPLVQLILWFINLIYVTIFNL